MKRLLTSLLLLASFGFAQTEVRIAGFDIDASNVNQVLDEVVRPSLEGEDINVTYEPIAGDFAQYLTNALSAGTAPDLFYVDIFWAESVIGPGAVAPIGDLLPDGYEDAFLDTLVQAYTREDNLYGIPKDFNNLALQYNRDIFDQAGVDYPSEDDTWDSFKEKLQTVQANLDDTYGICVVPDFARFGAFAFATGWQPFDESGRTVLDEDFRRAFEFYTGLVADDAGVTQDVVGSPGWMGGCFATDQVATAMEGLWVAGFLRDQAPNLAYATTFLPQDPETGERGNFVFTNSWSVNDASENKEAAIRVLEALTSPEAQTMFLEAGTAIPSRQELEDLPFFEQDTPAAELASVSFEAATGPNVFPYEFQGYGNTWKEIIDEALNTVLLGEQSVDEALEEAQTRLDDLTGNTP